MLRKLGLVLLMLMLMLLLLLLLRVLLGMLLGHLLRHLLHLLNLLLRLLGRRRGRQLRERVRVVMMGHGRAHLQADWGWNHARRQARRVGGQLEITLQRRGGRGAEGDEETGISQGTGDIKGAGA